MSQISMHFVWVRGSPGASPELRRAALLGALLVAAIWPAGRLAAGAPARPGQGVGYSAPPGRQQQLLFRRPGPQGKG